jgi:hypothetical protein
LKRVLLDEGVPKQVGDYLPGHEVTTVPRKGWASVKNGKLLALIEEAGFGAFITADKNLEAQQSLHGLPFGILLLSTNHWPSMKPHLEQIADALDHCKAGTILKVDCGSFVPRRMRKPIPGSP